MIQGWDTCSIPSLLISQSTCPGSTLVTISFQLLPMQDIQQSLRGRWLLPGIVGSCGGANKPTINGDLISPRGVMAGDSHMGCGMVSTKQPHLQPSLLQGKPQTTKRQSSAAKHSLRKFSWFGCWCGCFDLLEERRQSS